MSLFSFATDAKSEQYCKDAVDWLARTYRITLAQALYVVNQFWKGQDFLGEEDPRYDRGRPERWADHWKEEADPQIRLILDTYNQQVGPFPFATDAKSEQYCREVVDALVWEFGVSPSQAWHALNEAWKDHDFEGELDLRYHLGEPSRWAKRWKELSNTIVHQQLSQSEGSV